MGPLDTHVDFTPSGLDRAKEIFSDLGFVVVRNVLDRAIADSYSEHLRTAIQARLRSLDQQVTDNADLDESYRKLIAIDQRHGMEIIQIAKDMPDYYATMTSLRVQAIVRALLGDTIFQIVHDSCLFRIDPPGDTSRSFDWHQDYQYNVLSRSALTTWIPLTNITEEMGYLQVIPRSHQRIYPIQFHKEFAGTGKGTGHRVYSLCAPDLLSNADAARVMVKDVNPGDVLFLHSLLLHASGVNRSNRSRWICNVRFSDLLDKDVLSRGWLVVRDRTPNVFKEVHPDLVRE